MYYAEDFECTQVFILLNLTFVAKEYDRVHLPSILPTSCSSSLVTSTRSECSTQRTLSVDFGHVTSGRSPRMHQSISVTLNLKFRCGSAELARCTLQLLSAPRCVCDAVSGTHSSINNSSSAKDFETAPFATARRRHVCITQIIVLPLLRYFTDQ